MREAGTRHPFKKSDEVFRDEMPSRLADREPMIQGVLKTLEGLGCQLDPFFDRLFLDEVISNAIIHGNKENPEKRVTVRAFYDRRRWGFEITDQGEGFDWKAVREKLNRPMDTSKPSGRGLAIIHASGAEICFLRGGRRVVVVRTQDSITSRKE